MTLRCRNQEEFDRPYFREIHDDLGKPFPASGNLDRRVVQGMFPMNAVLTVRACQSGSHRGKGRETFASAVVRERQA